MGEISGAQAASTEKQYTHADRQYDTIRNVVGNHHVPSDLSFDVTMHLLDSSPLSKLGITERVNSLIEKISAVEIPAGAPGLHGISAEVHRNNAVKSVKDIVQRNIFQLNGREWDYHTKNAFSWIRGNVEDGAEIEKEALAIGEELNILGYWKNEGSTPINDCVNIVERRRGDEAPKTENAYEAVS